MADSDCAHAPCTCTVGDGGITAEDGRRYCSEGCKAGEGCVCPECGCSMESGIDGEDGSAVPGRLP